MCILTCVCRCECMCMAARGWCWVSFSVYLVCWGRVLPEPRAHWLSSLSSHLTPGIKSFLQNAGVIDSRTSVHLHGSWGPELLSPHLLKCFAIEWFPSPPARTFLFGCQPYKRVAWKTNIVVLSPRPSIRSHLDSSPTWTEYILWCSLLPKCFRAVMWPSGVPVLLSCVSQN